MDYTKTVLSTTEDQTTEIGRQLGLRLKGGEQIALHGDLGAGKTVFARGLARGLGIDEAVTSPTFTIVQEYLGAKLRFYHIDLYRLTGAEDAIAFGLEDYLDDERAVTAIEWSERIEEILEVEKLIHVSICHRENGREISVELPHNRV